MTYLLHIETSSTICSVALSHNNKLIAFKESNNGYTHAENLHLFIDEVLKLCSLQANNLSAIVISSGPGSYTGLRIGFSAAKGLAYALQIPLITIDTLQVLTQVAINHVSKKGLYCPMIDARRMEVYTAIYNECLTPVYAPKALVIDEESLNEFNKLNRDVYFFGDGMPKSKNLILKHVMNAKFIEDVFLSSKNMIDLAYNKFKRNDFSDVAYSEPNYLKDFFFVPSKK